jgi:hypothetical protein
MIRAKSASEQNQIVRERDPLFVAPFWCMLIQMRTNWVRMAKCHYQLGREVAGNAETHITQTKLKSGRGTGVKFEMSCPKVCSKIRSNLLPCLKKLVQAWSLFALL